MGKAKYLEAFEKYLSGFNMEDERIRLKYEHTFHVADNCELIAKSLNLSKKEIEIAWKIGMLHDVGRFRQLEKYQTFDDANSVDHAELGADVLFKEGLIDTFEDSDEDYEILEKAVRLHNKYRLPDDLEGRDKILCEIIRDADKVDIFRVDKELGMEKIYHVPMKEIEKSLITKEVYETFLQRKTIPRALHRTMADRMIGHFALAWELVFEESRRLVKEQGYIFGIMNVDFKEPETVKILMDVKDKITKYLGGEN